jgi:hypothetical protein
MEDCELSHLNGSGYLKKEFLTSSTIGPDCGRRDLEIY